MSGPPTTDIAPGGIFLTSHNPTRLVDWFNEALGIPMTNDGNGGMVLMPAGEHMTILSVQQATTAAPVPPAGDTMPEPYGRQTMMCNLRVPDLDAAIKRLKETGNEVAGPADYENIGRFAWTRTPDGHDIELWQP